MVDYTSENHALLSDPRLEHWLLRYPQNRSGGILLRDTPDFACSSPKYRSHNGQSCMTKKFLSRMDGLVDAEMMKQKKRMALWTGGDPLRILRAPSSKNNLTRVNK